MKKRKRLLPALLLALFSLFTLACSDDNTSNKPEGNPLYKTESSYTLDQLEQASRIAIMTYRMPGINGSEVEATSLVF